MAVKVPKYLLTLASRLLYRIGGRISAWAYHLQVLGYGERRDDGGTYHIRMTYVNANGDEIDA